MRQPALMLILAAAGCACAAAPRRDPFARPVAPVAAATAAQDGASVEPLPELPKPRVRAILFAPGHALANIDGQVLREGDRFGDWRIASIGERRVRLKRGADELVLPLHGEKRE